MIKGFSVQNSYHISNKEIFSCGTVIFTGFISIKFLLLTPIKPRFILIATCIISIRGQ